MIHEVHLSKVTCERLTDVLVLQMSLLDYALSVTRVDKDLCARYLDERVRFRGRGQQIAKWIWDAKTRWEPLQDFVECFESQDEEARSEEHRRKREWYELLSAEAWALLVDPTIKIELYRKDKAPNWQQQGVKFLERFYVDLCSPAKLPSYLFSEPGAGDFGRQEFLDEFVKANETLYVCAACDESSYFTIVEGNIRTDIDHYLPKSLYPHFSCHPYNLIPICKLCNQTSIKGNKDPLEALTSNGDRLSLADIYLPYRRPGLGTKTYLQVRLVKPGEDQREVDWVKLEKLVPRDASDLSINRLIEVLEAVYKIPNRWTQDGRVDKISETLFRRIRQFLGDGTCMPLGIDTPLAVYNILNQLLYYLYYEDQSKDPFAFAMTWILLALLSEELLAQESETEQTTKSDGVRSPLLVELIEGLGQNVNANIKREDFANSLREVVKENTFRNSIK
jgi:hypothetical protein